MEGSLKREFKQGVEQFTISQQGLTWKGEIKRHPTSEAVRIYWKIESYASSTMVTISYCTFEK